MSDVVLHLRTMRGEGDRQTDVSMTTGPVSVAVEELVRDLTERCGHVVRMGRRTWRLDGELVRQEFEVDITLPPDKYHDEALTYTWDQVVTRPSDPYQRMKDAALTQARAALAGLGGGSDE